MSRIIAASTIGTTLPEISLTSGRVNTPVTAARRATAALGRDTPPDSRDALRRRRSRLRRDAVRAPLGDTFGVVVERPLQVRIAPSEPGAGSFQRRDRMRPRRMRSPSNCAGVHHALVRNLAHAQVLASCALLPRRLQLMRQIEPRRRPHPDWREALFGRTIIATASPIWNMGRLRAIRGNSCRFRGTLLHGGPHRRLAAASARASGRRSSADGGSPARFNSIANTPRGFPLAAFPTISAQAST